MIEKTIATFLGIGYIGKGSGTIAALTVCLLAYLAVSVNVFTSFALIVFIVTTFIAGVYTAGKVEKYWGKDSKHVVIDEAMGMALTLLFSPINLFTLTIGFILFRFFDIYKPLYIKKTEQLPAGWGVMSDDLLAGIYANLILHLILFFIG
ncbi:MAG: phosphatidylglycerophosphatase [Chitinophagaceae bacterium]|nr:phosphatidylglycerophosphatase [Chitinophagaceae bacterium]